MICSNDTILRCDIIIDRGRKLFSVTFPKQKSLQFRHIRGAIDTLSTYVHPYARSEIH